MILKTLVENTSISEKLSSEHGLSLYVETAKHKLLFDTGKSDLFLKNAVKMGVNLADVDLVVLSHGHYDHGGGLRAFMSENSIAKVYIHKRAFEQHSAYRENGKIEEIGLDKTLSDDKRIVFTGDYLRIDEELELFSKIDRRELCSTSNKVLLMEENSNLVEDSFEHEQDLIISDAGTEVLLAGCSHRGIVNIVNQFIKMKGKTPDFVIGGFHLFNPTTKISEKTELIEHIGKFLCKTGSQYYTCHCTGLEAFNQLKQIMNHKLCYLATGDVVELNK